MAIPLGAPISRTWGADEVANPTRNSALEMREILGSQCSGVGLEFGAGSSPFPLALNAYPVYLDIKSSAQLHQTLYPGQSGANLVHSAFDMAIEKLQDWPENSLDFVVACHVIEHTYNPLGVLLGAYKALRRGGRLVLTVPDKERTFDRERQITSFEHVTADFRRRSKSRDLEHYYDYGKNVLALDHAASVQYAKEGCASGADIHYHVWDFVSFGEMIDKAEELIGFKWSEKKGIPTLPDDGAGNNIEFYYSLVK